jgi:hypothetical protein
MRLSFAVANIAEGTVALIVEDVLYWVDSAVPFRNAAELASNPLPETVIDVSEAPTVTESGESPLIIGAGFVTEIDAKPCSVESCVEVAVTVAVPPSLAVNVPSLLMIPTVDGLTVHVTAEL